MTSVVEAIGVGIMGILLFLLVFIAVFSVFSSIVYILCRIPSIPLEENLDGDLVWRNSRVIENGGFIRFVGRYVSIALFIFLIVYLVGFFLIEFGGITPE